MQAPDLRVLRRGKDCDSPDDPAGDEVTRAFQALSDRLRAFREEREWERFHTPRNLAVSISIEAGELLEQFQWVADEDIDRHIRDHLDAIQEEVADVAIYAVQLADVLGISLGAAIDSKIRRNAERYPVSGARGSSAKYDQLATQEIKVRSSR